MATRVTTKATRTLPCVYLCCNCQKINVGKVSFSAEASSGTGFTRSSTNQMAGMRRDAAQTRLLARQDKIIPAFNRGSYGMTTRQAVCSSCGQKQPWSSPSPRLSFAIAAVLGLLCAIYAFMIIPGHEFGTILGLFFMMFMFIGFLDMIIERIVFAVANMAARKKLAAAPSPYCAPLLFDPSEPVRPGNMNDPREAVIRQSLAVRKQ